MRWIRRLRRPRTVKGLLDEFFEDAAAFDVKQQSRLWAILTALRGPDSIESHYLKEYTTARIRHAVCEDLALSVGADVMPGLVVDPAPHWDRSSPSYNHHFAYHVAAAREALLAEGYE